MTDRKLLPEEPETPVDDVVEEPTEKEGDEITTEPVDVSKEEQAEKEEDKTEELPPDEEEKKEPTINISEFTESATTGSKEVGDSVNEDNVLEKMAALPFKERTAFYKANFELIDRACRKRKG